MIFPRCFAKWFSGSVSPVMFARVAKFPQIENLLDFTARNEAVECASPQSKLLDDLVPGMFLYLRFVSPYVASEPQFVE